MPGATKSHVLIVDDPLSPSELGKVSGSKAFVEHPQLPSATSNVSFFTRSGTQVLDRVDGLPTSPPSPTPPGQVQTGPTPAYYFFDGRNKVYAITIEDAHMDSADMLLVSGKWLPTSAQGGDRHHTPQPDPAPGEPQGLRLLSFASTASWRSATSA
jgi:hypothetical protein